MKKIFILGTVLALLAILAVPMAAFASDTASVLVSGYVDPATINVTAPTFAGFGNFSPGDNWIASTADGSVIVTPNSQTPSGWTVTAKDLAYGGYMYNGAVNHHLTNPLYISPNNWTSWNTADVGVSWSAAGLSGSMPTWLKQTIANNEVADNYYINITYTGQINF